MEHQRIVVTGVNGFVGHHLARKLAAHNITVIGIGREKEVHPQLSDIINEYYPADLIKEWPSIENVDAVIHLAGLAAVGPSFDNPQQYINGNSSMVTNMCEYFVRQDKKPRILIVSSGAIYDSHQSMPLSETSQVGFSSPYAISKILTENQAMYYRNRGLDCIIVRPFNHIGPGQGKGFILPDFFERLSGASPETSIKVGNLSTKRDYTDVRDIVEAYKKIVLSPTLKHTLYNVCSGKSLSGEDILQKLKLEMDRSDIKFEVDQSLIRPTDAAEIYGNSSRLSEELGWKPEYSIDDTVKDFVTGAQKSGL